jgi:hypothetical protein
MRRGLNFTLTTTAGDLDVLGEVAGGGTYEALLPHTELRDVLALGCRFVDLETLIRLKRAAGRPKETVRTARTCCSRRPCGSSDCSSPETRTRRRARYNHTVTDPVRHRSTVIMGRRFRSNADADRHDAEFWAQLPADQRVLLAWRLSVEQSQQLGRGLDEPGLCRSVASIRRA